MLTYAPQPSLEEADKQYRMYVLIRRDILPLVHCGVQGAHAAIEFMHYHPNDNTARWVVDHKTLIFLEASEKQIQDKMKWFADRHMNFQPFREPDMDNTLTAVCFQPIQYGLGKEVFKGFKLLK